VARGVGVVFHFTLMSLLPVVLHPTRA
jgi:hypothetical protein